MTIRLETTCEQCGTTVHSLAYGYSDHFSRNMWHLQCSACGRLTTEQPFDWGDFPASPQQSVITWIPVSERLPEEGTNRLICFESELRSRFVTEAFWDEHSEQWVYVGNNMPVNKNLTITHWAELPEPPKE